jgi:hypothetical protein
MFDARDYIGRLPVSFSLDFEAQRLNCRAPLLPKVYHSRQFGNDKIQNVGDIRLGRGFINGQPNAATMGRPMSAIRVWGKADNSPALQNVRFSNRPVGVKRFSDCPPVLCRCRSRACRQTNGRSKRTYELTSFIVPRGTSFHRSGPLQKAAYS